MDENTLETVAIDPKKLSKQELIQMLLHHNTAAENFRMDNKRLQEQLNEVIEARQKDTKDFNAYASRVERILQEQQRHHELRIATIFSSIKNMQTLLEGPDYSKAEESENPNAL